MGHDICKIWLNRASDEIVAKNGDIPCGVNPNDCCCEGRACACCASIWIGGTESDFCTAEGDGGFCNEKPTFQFHAGGDGLFISDVYIPVFSSIAYQGGIRCTYQGTFGCPPLAQNPDCAEWDPGGDHLLSFQTYIVYISFDVNTGCWKLHVEKQTTFFFPFCFLGSGGQQGVVAGLVTCLWGLGYNCTPNERCPCMPDENSWTALDGCWCEGCPPQGVLCFVNQCGTPCGDTISIPDCTALRNHCGCCGTPPIYAQPNYKPIVTPYWDSCYYQPDTGPAQCDLGGG